MLGRRRAHLLRRIESRVAKGDAGKDTHFDRGEAGALALAIWCVKKCQQLNLINARGSNAESNQEDKPVPSARQEVE